MVAPAADWPQWRGANRDGKSAETGLLDSWPKGGPRLLWKVQDLGEGYSGPAIVGDRLYIQGQQGGQQLVMAYDVHTGKQLWKTPAGRPFNGERGNGPRGTPTVDGARLYALSADGTLVCLETATRQTRLGAEPCGTFQRPAAELGVHRIAAGGWRPPHRRARRPRGGASWR